MDGKIEIISGSWNRVKNWVNKRIRIKDTGNTFVGEDSGKVTTGNSNNFIGHTAGYYNIGGHSNNFIGHAAGYSNIGGHYNNFVGHAAGYSNIGGHFNNFVGYEAGYLNSTGHSNIFIGHTAGYYNIGGHSNNFIGHAAGYTNLSGHSNCFIGYQAGYTNSTGVQNLFIGCKAGYYETGSNKLFIDNAPRADEADGRVKALLYGVFDAATANQRLSINAQLLVREVATYIDDAAAGTGGLVAGEIYKHADGSLHIKL